MNKGECDKVQELWKCVKKTKRKAKGGRKSDMVENAPMFINRKSHDMTCRIVRSCHGISCFFHPIICLYGNALV